MKRKQSGQVQTFIHRYSLSQHNSYRSSKFFHFLTASSRTGWLELIPGESWAAAILLTERKFTALTHLCAKHTTQLWSAISLTNPHFQTQVSFSNVIFREHHSDLLRNQKPYWLQAHFCTPKPREHIPRVLFPAEPLETHRHQNSPHPAPRSALRVAELGGARAGALRRGPAARRLHWRQNNSRQRPRLWPSGSRCDADPGVPPIPVSRPSRPYRWWEPCGRAASPPRGARGRCPRVARGGGAAPARPCPRGLSGRCGGHGREGRREVKGCLRLPAGMRAVFSNPSTVLFSGRNAKLKELLGSACGRNQFKFGAGGSAEQLPLLSTNCALVTISNQVMQYHLVHMSFISVYWPVFLLLSKIFLDVHQISHFELWRENRLWMDSHRYYNKCFMCIMLHV